MANVQALINIFLNLFEIVAIIVGILTFPTGLVLLFFKKHRKLGGILMVSAVALVVAGIVLPMLFQFK